THNGTPNGSERHRNEVISVGLGHIIFISLDVQSPEDSRNHGIPPVQPRKPSPAAGDITVVSVLGTVVSEFLKEIPGESARNGKAILKRHCPAIAPPTPGRIRLIRGKNPYVLGRHVKTDERRSEAAIIVKNIYI